MISNLNIRNFRMFGELEIPRCGQLNLLVGRNNTGKSSILEALCLLAANGSTRSFSKILLGRDEAFDRGPAPIGASFCLLHRGAPEGAGFELRTGDRVLTARPAYFRWAEEEDLPGRRLKRLGDTDDPDGAELRLEVEWNQGRRVLPLDERLFRRPREMGLSPDAKSFQLSLFDSAGEAPDLPWVFVGTEGLNIEEMSALWSGIALTDLQDRIAQQLRSCFSEIEGVSIIQRGVRPAAIVKVKGSDRPVALRSLGEGAHRFFCLAMAAASASNGILLIDEVEIGIHHSIQLELWRLLASMAADFNVQVFATTHNEDTVKAFGVVAEELPEGEGQLIRLQNRNGMIEAVNFDSSELAYIRTNGLEVR